MATATEEKVMTAAAEVETTPKKRGRAKAKSPSKKATTTKKRSTSKKPAAAKSTGPKYVDMVAAGIDALHERGGSSRQALKKYVLSNFKVNYATFERSFRTALARGVETGVFVQNKQSFRLAPAAAKKVAKEGSVPTTKRGRAKSTTAKKTTTTKAKAKTPAKKKATTTRAKAKSPAAKKKTTTTRAKAKSPAKKKTATKKKTPATKKKATTTKRKPAAKKKTTTKGKKKAAPKKKKATA